MGTLGFEFHKSLYPGSGVAPTRIGKLKASEVVVKGNLLVAASGYLLNAVANDTEIYGVCQESKTASAVADATEVVVIPALPGYLWKVEFSGTYSIAGDRYVGTVDIADANTVNLDDVSGGCLTVHYVNNSGGWLICSIRSTLWVV